MYFKLNTLFSILLLSFSHASYSKCSKEDVEFYLDKGFTQEQITQLCATSEGASVPDYQPYQQKVIIYSNEEAPGIKDGFTREEREAIKEIKLGADVIGLTVDQDKIKYTSQICLAVQEGKEYNQRLKTCPDVDFEVDRVGLQVSAHGKKYGLFGQNAVKVNGKIKRTLKADINDYPPQFRKQLKRHYDFKASKQSVNFPARGDYSVTKLANSLNVLSKTADSNSNETVAQNEEPPKEVIRDEAETRKEFEEEKKKRWWNPFD